MSLSSATRRKGCIVIENLTVNVTVAAHRATPSVDEYMRGLLDEILQSPRPSNPNGRDSARGENIRGWLATSRQRYGRGTSSASRSTQQRKGREYSSRDNPPNDPSSATRPAGRMNCNRSAMAGFAAAPG